MKRSLSDLTRPQSFAAVQNQSDVIRMIREDVRLGRPRHLIIAGPSGTGKTSTARLVARAHACKSPDANGSHCENCEACSAMAAGFSPDYHEVDCPNGSAKEDLAYLLDVELANQPWALRRHVTLFDEADALSRQAQAMLLGPLQEEKPWLFIFTLIDPDQLSKPLRDRCRVLRLELPTVPQAHQYLIGLADSQHFDVEQPAFRLIAQHANGYRELADSLEQVADYCAGRRVTADDVRERLLRDSSYGMLSFLIKTAQLKHDEAVVCLDQMTISAPEKLSSMIAIVRHLMLAYAAPVRSRRADDGLAALLVPAECQRVVSAFAARAGELGSSALAILDAVLEFLLRIPSDVDEDRLAAHLARCHVMLSSGAPRAPDMPPQPNAARQHPARHPTKVPDISGASPRRSRAPARASASGEQGSQITIPQAAELYEALTFLAQQYGRPINAVLTVDHQKLGPMDDESAATAVSELLRQLRARFFEKRVRTEGAAHDLHRVTFHERSRYDRLKSTVIFHLPSALEKDIRWWLANGFLAARGVADPGAVELEVEYPVGAGFMKRQWALARRFWGGLRSEASVDGMSLLDVLQVPNVLRRDLGQIGCRRLTFSQSLSDKSFAQVKRDRMDHLSAWADRRWDQLFTGWELKEHKDRSSEIAKRFAKISELAAAFAGEGSFEQTAALAAVAREEESWPAHPHDRVRSWRGWWADD